MKYITVLLAMLGSIFTSKAEEMTHTKEPLSEIKKAVDEKKAVIVDVREKSEWDEGHLKGAVFLPLSGLKADGKIPAELPKDKPLYVHCVKGVRALKAAVLLKEQGYDARALKPGFGELSENGFVVAPKE